MFAGYVADGPHYNTWVACKSPIVRLAVLPELTVPFDSDPCNVEFTDEEYHFNGQMWVHQLRNK